MVLFYSHRHRLYYEGLERFKSDGLNSLIYNRLALEFRALYTWIYVQASEAEIVRVCHLLYQITSVKEILYCRIILIFSHVYL